MSYSHDKENNHYVELQGILATVRAAREYIARKESGSLAYEKEVRKLKHKLLNYRDLLMQYDMQSYFRPDAIEKMTEMERGSVLELLRLFEEDLSLQVSKYEEDDHNCDGCPMQKVCNAIEHGELCDIADAVVLLLMDERSMFEVIFSPDLLRNLMDTMAFLNKNGIIFVFRV